MAGIFISCFPIFPPNMSGISEQCHCTSRRNPMIKFGLKKLNHVYLKNIFNDYGLCTESKLDFHHCLSSPMLERQAFSVSKSCE